MSDDELIERMREAFMDANRNTTPRPGDWATRIGMRAALAVARGEILEQALRCVVDQRLSDKLTNDSDIGYEAALDDVRDAIRALAASPPPVATPAANGGLDGDWEILPVARTAIPTREEARRLYRDTVATPAGPTVLEIPPATPPSEAPLCDGSGSYIGDPVAEGGYPIQCPGCPACPPRGPR